MRGYNIKLLGNGDTVLYDFKYSFSSSKLTLGTTDASALERFDSADEFIRRGDNLLSPEMLVIFGDVVKTSFTDLRDEINDIRDALATTTKVLYISASTNEYEFVVVPTHSLEVKEINHSRHAAKLKIQLNTGAIATGIPLPVLWHDAAQQVYTDAGSTEATHGDTIQQWNNIIDPPNPSTQSVSTRRAILDTTTFSHPTVYFDAVGAKCFELPIYLNTDWTVFAVIRPKYRQDTIAINRAIFGYRNQALNGPSIEMQADNASVNQFVDVGAGVGGLIEYDRVFSQWYVQSASYDSTSQVLKLYSDERLLGQSTLTGAPTATDTNYPGFLGATYVNTASPHHAFQGYMTDFLIYNRALSASEHKQVVKHLKNKVGITTEKPNGVEVDFWLAADERVYTDADSLTEASATDNVQTWLGKSNTHRSGYRTTGGIPTLQTVDGISAISFDGNDNIRYNFWLDFGTVFVVQKLTNTANSNRTLLCYWGGHLSTPSNYHLRSSDTNGDVEAGVEGFADAVGTRVANAWNIVHARMSDSDGVELSVDGTVEETTSSGTRVAPSKNLSYLPMIGLDWVGSGTHTYGHIGYIAEIIASERRMNDTEYDSVLSYLQTKYASVL